MATPAYPSTLPIPSTYSLRPESLLATSGSDADGPVAQRRRSRQSYSQADLGFKYLEGDYAIFRAFWETDLKNGHKWFTIPAPTAQGIVPIVVRFVDPRMALKGFNYAEISVAVEIRERPV